MTARPSACEGTASTSQTTSSLSREMRDRRAPNCRLHSVLVELTRIRRPWPVNNGTRGNLAFVFGWLQGVGRGM